MKTARGKGKVKAKAAGFFFFLFCFFPIEERQTEMIYEDVFLFIRIITIFISLMKGETQKLLS